MSNFNSLLLHYQALTQFNHTYREGLLDVTHLESGRKHFTKFKRPGGAEEEVDFWGYMLERQGVRYLVDFADDPTDELPILIRSSELVSYRSDAYNLVSSYAVARYKSEKRMSFRELVLTLCGLDHSNRTHQTLLVFVALASYMQRLNLRICSPPSVGKDSSVQLMNSLVGGCTPVGSPTMAKLEYKTGSQWMVINEMMKLGKTEWNNIEQFLLNAGDRKPHLEKHSLGYNGGADSYDISDLSLGIFYNDITAYSDDDEYFDLRATNQLKDRFPALRVHGSYTERFDRINSVNIRELVANNMDVYKDIIYTIIYFKKHLEDELHRYNHDTLHIQLGQLYGRRVPQRHRDNLSVLLKVVDLYCDNQEEFDNWVNVIVDSMRDYQDMLEYPHLESAAKRMLNRDGWSELQLTLRDLDTFTKKNAALRDVMRGDAPVKDVSGLW